MAQAMNKQALRSFQQSTQKSAARLNQKSLEILGETLFYYAITQRVTIKSKINIKVRSLWWLASIQSHMFILLSQLMAMALNGQSNDANFRILERHKMMEDLPVLKIIIMGFKFPPLTPN